jgi:formate hydrogenlyase subunit 4
VADALAVAPADAADAQSVVHLALDGLARAVRAALQPRAGSGVFAHSHTP